MRLLLIILVLLASMAQSATAALHPSAIKLELFNIAGDDSTPIYLELLSGSPSYIVGFDGGSKTISQWTLGSGMSLVSGALTSTASAPANTFSTPSRSYNTAWQPSVTRDIMVIWSSNVTLSSVVLTAATGTVASKYADNSGITTNVVTTRSLQNSLGGVLATGINPTGGTLVVPAGKWAILTTTTNSGTVNFGTLEVQEIGF